MAYGNSNPSGGGGGDMYSDAEPAAAPAPKDPDNDGDTHEEGGGETALVPQSLCPGMKPGEEMVVKIDSLTENDYVVSYAPEKGKGEGEAPAAPPAESGEGGGSMASMME